MPLPRKSALAPSSLLYTSVQYTAILHTFLPLHVENNCLIALLCTGLPAPPFTNLCCTMHTAHVDRHQVQYILEMEQEGKEEEEERKKERVLL